MPRPHTTMRKIREVLRLVLQDNLSRRTTSLSLSIPRSSVNDLVVRAQAAGLSWELVNELDDAQFEARLFRHTPPESSRPQPNFLLVKKELRKKGVTLSLLWIEYSELHPDGYAYSQFCNLYLELPRFDGHLNFGGRPQKEGAQRGPSNQISLRVQN